jgi:hypothetical protein
MGKIQLGILGEVSGKVGPVVGSNWKGINTVRARPRLSKKAPTQQQTEQRSKFALVTTFAKGFAPLAAVTFIDGVNQQTGFNKVMAHSIKTAITGVWPNFTVDYSQVLVGRGSLPNVQAPAAAAGAAGIVSWHWTDNSGMGKANANDTAVLVVYCEALGHGAYTTTGAVRSAGAGTLNVPGLSGQSVHTWITFLSLDGKDAATSIYTGKVNVV